MLELKVLIFKVVAIDRVPAAADKPWNVTAYHRFGPSDGSIASRTEN